MDFANLIDDGYGRPPPKEAKPLAFALTDDQKTAIERIEQWLAEGVKMMVLTGHAGTGKSTLVQEIVRRFRGRVALTAPTNKATKVLRTMASERDIPAEAFTVYSANGLRLQDDARDKYVTKGGKGKVDEYRLIVVDEASMVGERLFAFCEEENVVNRVPFLFVGDPLQLDPVKDGRAPAFGLPNRVELTKIVRQAEGNPIIAFGDHMRGRIARDGRPSLPLPVMGKGEGDGLHLLSQSRWRDLFVERVAAAKDRPGSVRAIAFTNAATIHCARLARAAIFGAAAPPYVQGERVFSAKPWDILYTDEEATVDKVDAEQPHPDFPEWRTIPMTLKNDNGVTIMAWAIHPDQAEEFGKATKERFDAVWQAEKFHGRSNATRVAWKEAHAFCDAFADFRSVFSITTHRSQGSTFDEVFVNTPDIKRATKFGDESVNDRLLYVAVTRARRAAHLMS